VRTSLEERFWSKVKKTRGCWNWTGSCTPDSYGKFRVGRRHVRASRFAYEDLVGPIDPDLRLAHNCENPLCVRPDHMQPLTQREITLRGVSPAANNAAKTMCDHGHPLTGENLYIEPRTGGRRCVTCRRRVQRERRGRFQGPRRSKPGRVVLRIQMERMNFTELGEHYGVTDTAVRKWAKEYELR
jgi:hypothetical protein